MEQSDVTLKELVEVGAHFGHRVWKCNPKMSPYIFENRRGISIIDLRKTLILLRKALATLHNTAALGGQILFVSTRKQNADAVKEVAQRTAQFYVNHRWLGGTLTNWGAVSLNCNRLAELEREFEKKSQGLTKKEALRLIRERDKMQHIFSGIKDLRGLPSLLVVLDVNKDKIAVAEAKKLKIPTIALIDTNSDISLVDFPIPANDDSKKTVNFLLKLFGDAVLSGLKRHLEGTPSAEKKKPVESKKPAEKKQLPELSKEKDGTEQVKEPAAKKAEPEVSSPATANSSEQEVPTVKEELPIADTSSKE